MRLGHRRSAVRRFADGHSDARTLRATPFPFPEGRQVTVQLLPTPPHQVEASQRNASRLQHLQELRSVGWISKGHRFRPLREARTRKLREVSALSPFHGSVLPRFRCSPRHRRRKRPEDLKVLFEAFADVSLDDGRIYVRSRVWELINGSRSM